jgi:aminomethyltransferase
MTGAQLGSTTTPGRRETSLHDAHLALGARMVSFAGWEMPVSYQGVSVEHLAVRSGCGVFDVSHMGEIETVGPDAEALLQRLLSNDVEALDDGRAQYAVLCRADGGMLDDLITYRLAECRYLTVTNAANHERDLAWFQQHATELDVEVRDAAERFAMLAVQGPTARELAAPLLDGELPGRMRVAAMRLAGALGGAEALVGGTGYTGEDGIEVLVDPADVPALWSALIEAGAVPAGLAARDTLRLEACLRLYGNELAERWNPIEAGLGWCCREATGFVGCEAIATVRERGPARRLMPFVLTEPGVPRQGNPIVRGDAVVGEVTSGTHSPSLGIGIGIGYLDAQLAEPGAEVEIDVRGRRRAARLESEPLYERKGG